MHAVERLGRRTVDAIASPDSLVYVSAASVWEMSIKHRLGRLVLPERLLDELRERSFSPLAVTLEHALSAGALPRHHNDPFDRMLVAQAQAEGLTLVTADRAMAAYRVHLMSAG